MKRWQEMTPTEVLAANEVLDLVQVAYVLRLVHQKGSRAGEPNRRLALELVMRDELTLVDPAQPHQRWTVAASVIRRYIAPKAVAS